jgi:hypothetical protein
MEESYWDARPSGREPRSAHALSHLTLRVPVQIPQGARYPRPFSRLGGGSITISRLIALLTVCLQSDNERLRELISLSL